MPRMIKTALFVDFDNIYSGLRDIEAEAAERFATDPARWLTWIEGGMLDDTEPDTHVPVEREVLIRRCYLNPARFARYRPYFTRTAFSVIDCPQLTAASKNGADIHMVMDILDTLEHPTHFDEFIILSGDADFTPVLLRLRAHDRQTAILVIGPAAEAYKAACNRVLTEDVFVEAGLQLTPEPLENAPAIPGSTSPASAQLIHRMARRLYEEASTNGEVPATILPKFYMQFKEFVDGRNWLGFYSLRALTNALIQKQPALKVVEGDPWKVTLAPAVLATPARRAEAEPRAGPPLPTEPIPVAPDDDLRTRILNYVQSVVAVASEPVTMAKVAQELISQLGSQVIETQWAGAGTFKNLLQSADLPHIAMFTAPDQPGYLYDPRRHSAVITPPAEVASPEQAAFTRRLCQITGAPRFTSAQYGVLFRALAADLNRHPFHQTTTSKTVRDQCIERGQSISRQNVNFVINGLKLKNYDLSPEAHSHSAATIAEYFRDNLLALCEYAQLELSAEERRWLDEWLFAEIEEA